MISITRSSAANYARRIAADKVPALAYHALVPYESEYLYSVSTSQFEEHLACFRDTDKLIVPVTRMPRITFDDGHSSDFRYSFPRLETAGVKATFFVLPGKVDSSLDSISWNQARTMISAGHHIESHGWSHRMLTQCSEQELEREIIGSKLEIEDRLGRPVTSFSVPGGRWDARVVDMCARAGYTTLFHSNPWAPERKMNGVLLRGRLMVNRDIRGNDLIRFATAGRNTRILHRSTHAVKRGMRRVLGDDLYHSLWCRLAKFRPGDGIELALNAQDRGSPR